MTRYVWLFSPRVDIAAFLGSALVSILLLLVGWHLGLLHGDAPEWAWIGAVLLVDVAHVWSTVFRVYLDRDELLRRPYLYALAPVCAYLVGVALYSESAMLFWRVLAYLAVFHFVRQQYGWVALYRARAGARDRLGSWLDTLAIYAATLYPLLHWHAHLPRSFWWFLPGDFAALPAALRVIVTWLEPLYWAILAAYAVRAIYDWVRARRGECVANPGKDIVVVTTALCWYVGIVALATDYAFTVTNVIIHGVPYLVLVTWYAAGRGRAGRGGAVMRLVARVPWIVLAVVWTAAFLEELAWDRVVWHERAYLFGSGGVALEHWQVWLVPLLAVPQATHYVLDGFIWRRRSNPSLGLG